MCVSHPDGINLLLLLLLLDWAVGTITWSCGGQESTVDLTPATSRLARSLIKCDVHDTKHGSDHEAIETIFSMSMTPRKERPGGYCSRMPHGIGSISWDRVTDKDTETGGHSRTGRQACESGKRGNKRAHAKSETLPICQEMVDSGSHSAASIILILLESGAEGLERRRLGRNTGAEGPSQWKGTSHSHPKTKEDTLGGICIREEECLGNSQVFGPNGALRLR